MTKTLREVIETGFEVTRPEYAGRTPEEAPKPAQRVHKKSGRLPPEIEPRDKPRCRWCKGTLPWAPVRECPRCGAPA